MASLDLGQIEHVIDQSEQVPAVGLKALEDAQHLLGWLTVSAVRHQFGIAQDGVERRAQLMAHIGEELRFVLACLFKLPALVLDLMEQPRILDGQRRLRRKGLDDVDGVLRKLSRRAAANHQHADDIFPTQQRRHHPRAVAGTQDDLVKVRGGFFPQVGDLSWLALCEDCSDVRVIKADVPLREGAQSILDPFRR